MDKDTKDELLNKIKTLETDSNNITAIESEQMIESILKPLLLEDRFKIIQEKVMHDKGFDFIAVKEKTEKTSRTTVGIEYKHYKNYVSKVQVQQLIEALHINSFNRAILVTNSKFTNAAKEAAIRLAPVAIELVDIDRLKKWILSIEVEMDINKLEIEEILKLVSHKFAFLVAQNPENLYKLEWRDLERMVAEIFEGIGFDVELTPSSKDGGKDIILSCNVFGRNKSYIVEIKHWRSGIKVGQSAIKDFLNVIVKERRDSGLYLSTFGYCNNSFESLSEIEKQKIRFGDKEKIVSLCKVYTKVSSGIWSPTQNLAEILFDKTV